LSDPVSKYLPSFRSQVVRERDEKGDTVFVPVRRELTIRDLLTMSDGIDGRCALGGANADGVPNIYVRMGSLTTAQLVDEVARVPLVFHPGEQWAYSISMDVVGRLIEVLADMRLGEYVQKAICGPLGMEDTGYFVPESKQGRFAVMYELDGAGGFRPSHFMEQSFRSQPSFEMGGGGMVSTIADMSRFGQALLGGGEFEGARILSRGTVRLMSSNLLNAAVLRSMGNPDAHGYGWGASVRVLMDPARSGENGSAGQWGWDGMAGTWFFMDPAEDMICVFITQKNPGDHGRTRPEGCAVIYGALI